jgi:hypothetical protein
VLVLLSPLLLGLHVSACAAAVACAAHDPVAAAVAAVRAERAVPFTALLVLHNLLNNKEGLT